MALQRRGDDVTVIEPLFLPFGKAYHGKDEFLGLAQVLPNYLDVSSITGMSRARNPRSVAIELPQSGAERGSGTCIFT